MTPAVVVGLVVATAAASAVLGAHLERWRHHRATAAALQIIDRFATDNLARAARQDAEGPWRGQWIAPELPAWAAFQQGREHPEEN